MELGNTDSFFVQWYYNKVFFTGFWCWAVAQSIKVLLGVIREKRFNFKWFVGSGGMPSSHTALTSGMAVSCGLYYGFDSAIFGLASAFAVVTMFDAQGVRRQSGKQAEALNKILEDLFAHRGLQEQRLKELVGHSPNEVFAGSLLGIVMALLMRFFWFAHS